MSDIVKLIALYVTYFAEIAAALVIVIGSIQVIWIYFRRAIFSKTNFNELNRSRLKLGYSLSLGLGFLVGADVIKTAIAPTWNDIGILATIIFLRTFINFFLIKDLKELDTVPSK